MIVIALTLSTATKEPVYIFADNIQSIRWQSEFNNTYIVLANSGMEVLETPEEIMDLIFHATDNPPANSQAALGNTLDNLQSVADTQNSETSTNGQIS